MQRKKKTLFLAIKIQVIVIDVYSRLRVLWKSVRRGHHLQDGGEVRAGRREEGVPDCRLQLLALLPEGLQQDEDIRCWGRDREPFQHPDSRKPDLPLRQEAVEPLSLLVHPQGRQGHHRWPRGSGQPGRSLRHFGPVPRGEIDVSGNWIDLTDLP